MLKGPYFITVTCPHCGMTSNLHNAVERFDNDRMEFMNCATEEGGCDRDFLIKIRITATVETYDFVSKVWNKEGYK